MSNSERLLAAVAALALGACELEEVTLPLGQEVVVVQAVLSLDSATAAQYVVVERSLTGTEDIPDQDSLRGPPRPPLPISGADVVVTRDDGDSVRYLEIPDTLGVYRIAAADMAGFLQPGREYRLRVRAPDGREVTGLTRIPFPYAVQGLPPEGAAFNRDRDTLRVSWTGGQGSKSAFVQIRPRDVTRWVRMVLWTDSAGLAVPGRLAFPLPSDTLPADVWIAGTRETFTVAAMDANFYDFFRTANDPFTGSGFVNHLEGGIGVFGAMVPVSRTYDVVADIDHPWEGRYELTCAGACGDTLTLYVTRDNPAPVLVGALAERATGLFQPRFEATGAVNGDGSLVLAVVADPPGPEHRQRRALLAADVFVPNGTTSGTIYNPSTGAAIGAFALRRLP